MKNENNHGSIFYNMAITREIALERFGLYLTVNLPFWNKAMRLLKKSKQTKLFSYVLKALIPKILLLEEKTMGIFAANCKKTIPDN